MKNLKKLSAIVLSTLLATTQISFATFENFDTGLGKGTGMTGAIIDSHSGGLTNITKSTNKVDLDFNSNTHVKWDNLNLNNNETMNFNSASGANNLTILNTVNNNMSKIYGTINADSGIGKLIISNPNGVLFDGAKFTTAGDAMITTKDMSLVNVNSITDGVWAQMKDSNDLIQVQILNNSDFSVGGELKILAPKIVAENSTIKAGNTLRLITANGEDYVATELPKANKMVTKLTAMNIDGDIVITNGVGAFAVTDGGTFNGNLTAETGGYVRVNEQANGNTLNINGDVDINAHNQQLIFRHSDVKGNVNLKNDGGFVDLGNTHVSGDANLTTKGFEDINSNKFNHYVHVVGDTDIDGDLNIESSQNIHIGNYSITKHDYPYEGNLLDGKLKVGGDLNAHTTAGHIMTTIDTTAKNINFKAEKYNDGVRNYGGNILSDGKAVLSAETYQFDSAGYIGGLKGDSTNSVDNKVINLMENYTFIPADTSSHEYMVINGGSISKINTPKVSAGGNDVQVYIKSINDLTVNGANAGVINLNAPDKKITITGDVHAKEINVADRTGTLQLDFPNRDFTTNYTNIKDGKVVTIAPNEKITYELTNKPKVGYNSPDFKQTNGSKTTYLVGPDAPKEPDPVKPKPDPVKPTPKPVNPTPNYKDNGENARNMMTQNTPSDVMAAPVNTPVAFAADLDEDDIEGPIRKNVDGSVTVVRAYPLSK